MLKIGLSLTAPRASGLQTLAFGPGDTLVFAMIGQSNMVGRAAHDGGSTHPAGTRQWGRVAPNDGALIPADHPLEHHDPNPGQMGLDITLAEAVLAAHPGVDLVLVPLADGGTGFSDNRWNPGDDLYQDAVARLNAVMAQNPGFTFAGFLWHQGEKDVGFAGYQSALDAMIAGLRADVAAASTATPFILGDLVPGWVAGNTGRAAVQAVISDTPARVGRTGVASAEGLTGAGADVHFTAQDLRGLGTRYFQAWAAVFAGQGAGAPQATGTIADQVDVLPGLPAPVTIGTIPDQTDTLGQSPPVTIGSIPDQTDPVGLAAPQAVGTIPDQQDIAA